MKANGMRMRVSDCLQMVVVSDDVHEYAVALKDTEEKIARCPARVSPLRLFRSYRRLAFLFQVYSNRHINV